MNDDAQQSQKQLQEQPESTNTQAANSTTNAPANTTQNAVQGDGASQAQAQDRYQNGQPGSSQHQNQNENQHQHQHQHSQPDNLQHQSDEHPKRKPRKGLIIGIVAALVVIIVAAALLVPNVVGKASAESVEECNLQMQALSAHQEALKTTEESAKAAAEFTDKDVADTSTLKDLKAAQKEVDELGDAPTCPSNGSQSEVDEATNRIRDYAENLRSATSGLDAAAKAAIASHEELTGAEE